MARKCRNVIVRASSTRAGDSDSFYENVGVHQGSVLSPLLFAIAMDQMTKGVRVGLPWELLYADDLVLNSRRTEGKDRLLEELPRIKRNEDQCGENEDHGKVWQSASA